VQEPSTPQAGMEKRLLLALAISFLVIIVWQMVFPPPRPAPRPPAPAPVGQAAAPAPQPVAPAPAPAPASAPAQEFPEKQSRLANDVLALELTSLGAGIRKVTLLDYWDSAAHKKARDPQHHFILFDLPAGVAPIAALGIERQGARSLETAPWELVREEPQAVTYRLKEGETQFEKEIRLPPGARHAVVAVRTSGAPCLYRLCGGFALKEEMDITGGVSELLGHLGTVTAGNVINAVPVTIVGKTTNPAPVRTIVWGAVSSRFFGLIMRGLPANGAAWADFLVEGRFEIVPDVDPARRNAVLGAYALSKGKGVAELAPFERDEALAKLPRTGRPVLVAKEVVNAAHEYEIFLGPKDPGVLESYKGLNYTGVIDYGSWMSPGWLVAFFLVILKALFAVVRDYGLAILILTLLVKVCLHPLNRKNQKAMQGYQAKLSRIQPELDRLKERYKNNRRKLQQEMQKTMHENGVNPNEMLGGCLLMFIQLPIWVALIAVFRVAIELRQAPALFGILGDLSLPDRAYAFGFPLPLVGWEYLNVLPILYVVLTLVQQRMMPVPKEEHARQQHKMMSFMMVFFGFIFYNFSSGLLLYFLTSSTLGIVEQKIIRRELAAESAAVPVKP
jgi:YidC/Oxa1 family membrane protein insertase